MREYVAMVMSERVDLIMAQFPRLVPAVEACMEDMLAEAEVRTVHHFAMMHVIQ